MAWESGLLLIHRDEGEELWGSDPQILGEWVGLGKCKPNSIFIFNCFGHTTRRDLSYQPGMELHPSEELLTTGLPGSPNHSIWRFNTQPSSWEGSAWGLDSREVSCFTEKTIKLRQAGTVESENTYWVCFLVMICLKTVSFFNNNFKTANYGWLVVLGGKRNPSKKKKKKKSNSHQNSMSMGQFYSCNVTLGE